MHACIYLYIYTHIHGHMFEIRIRMYVIDVANVGDYFIVFSALFPSNCFPIKPFVTAPHVWAISMIYFWWCSDYVPICRFALSSTCMISNSLYSRHRYNSVVVQPLYSFNTLNKKDDPCLLFTKQCGMLIIDVPFWLIGWLLAEGSKTIHKQ